jgi:hypothetical protein
VRTFASNDGSGTPLSIGTGTATVIAGTTNPISLTLDAVVGSLQIAVSPASFTDLTAGTGALTVNVLDPAGDAIPYATATLADANNSLVSVLLTDSDGSGATSVSPSTLGSGAETFTYTGQSISGSISLTATAKNAGGTTVASASTSVAFAAPPIGSISANPTSLAFLNTGSAYAQTVTVSQSNYSGAFTATTSGGTTGAVTTNVSGSVVTVTPQEAGTTSVVIAGGSGNTITIPVTVTVSTLTIH